MRFSADEVGQWSFRSSSENSLLDGHTASFTVTTPSDDAPEFYRWGRLEAVGTAENKIRYLKFRDGPYWLKAGCDDPENFFGKYKNYDTLEKRKAAVDYLAERGINSFYILSHNIDGDDKDVWPWLGRTAKEAKTNSAGEVRYFDEGRPEEQRAAWWAAYMAGGVWESHVLPPYDRPMSAWETTWNELGGARAFMESLPFWEMRPHNELVTSGEALCLAQPGEAYGLYLPNGGQVTLELPTSGEYQFDWWNPANGIRAKFADGNRVAKGQRPFTAPTQGDWALRVMRSKP